MKFLRHPLTAPLGALLLGVLAAAVLGGRAGATSIELPEALAAALSDTGERELHLAHPDAIWLLPMAVLPFLVLVVRRSLVDLPAVQIAVQTVLRVALLLAIGFALGQPSLRAPVRGKTVVFAIDVSDSINDEQLAMARRSFDEALGTWAREDEQDLDREDRTRLRLALYAEQAQAVAPDSLTADAIVRPGSATLGSDHAGALRLAQALLDPDTEGRVVLLTDGQGSLAEREELARAADELKAAGVELSIRILAGARRSDVVVEGVFVPRELRVGQTFDVVVDLWSSAPQTLTLHLTRDGEANTLAPFKEVSLPGGPIQIRMPSRVTRPGPVTFGARLDTAALSPAQNATTLNDAATTIAQVRGRPRVLHVGSDGSGALPRALRVDHLAVDDVSAKDFPTDVAKLRPFDLVIFSDVSARTFSGDKQRALATYVEDFGGGFIMVGGENAFGVGGWGGTIVEGLLPVRFEGERQRQQPTLALVLVIDKSGSMSSEDKLDLVKEAARATARALEPSDELGVIAFDSRPQVLVRLQPAANRIRIASDIRRLSAGGGTNALPALREAYLQLAGSNALVKHVILLSDGQSPETGVSALLADMRDADITVSAVGVGAGAGKDFLHRVAQQGRGRFYFSQDGTDVPRIFSRETNEVTRNAVVEREMLPRVAKSVQALRGIDFSRAPGLRGLVPIKPKAMSEVLLRTHHGDPLLVRGRRGLGRTAAFASDAKPRWAARWMTWAGFPKLWSQLARDTMRQGAGVLGGATLSVTASGPGRYRAVVDTQAAEGFPSDLVGKLRLIDPQADEDAPAQTIELQLTAPGRYEAEIPTDATSNRLVEAQLFDPGQDPPRLAAEAVDRIATPYPPEVAPKNLNRDPTWLSPLSAGEALEGPVGEIVARPGDAGGRTRSRALWPLAIWLLVLPLLILDLLARRIAFGTRPLGS